MSLTVLLPVLAVVFAFSLLLAYAFEPGGVFAAEEERAELTYDELLEVVAEQRQELERTLKMLQVRGQHPLALLGKAQNRLDPEDLSLRELRELAASLEAVQAMLRATQEQLSEDAGDLLDRVETLERKHEARVRRSEAWLEAE